MPTYVYFCPTCQDTLEVEQKMSDAPLKVCPYCGKKGIKRKIHSPAVVFNAPGFYCTRNTHPVKGGK